MLSAIKRVIRRAVVPTAFRNYPRLIIASSGRAGSTMVFDAIADSLIQARFGWSRTSTQGKIAARNISGYIDRISAINDEPYQVSKTHDTFCVPSVTDYRIIFVYGDPLDSAMSVARVVNEMGADWFEQHQYHLRASGSFTDLFNADVLNYEGQMRSWLGECRDHVLCVDYEDLWSATKAISDFVGFDVNLPERRPRKTMPSQEIVNQDLFTALCALKAELKLDYERRYRGK